MAAALALAFQSSHLQDGLLEYLTMVRGCNLIASDGFLDTAESAFDVSPPPRLLFNFTIKLKRLPGLP